MSQWAEMYGLQDVWRWKHPNVKPYTSHSATYASSSRIDSILAGGSLLSRIQEVEILFRSISDHATLLLRLGTDSPPGTTLWRLSSYWITDERVAPEIAGVLGVYWGHNIGTADPPVIWDAYKAYARGQSQRIIGRVRKDTRLALEAAELKALRLESDYVHSRDKATYTALQAVHREISLLRTFARPNPEDF